MFNYGRNSNNLKRFCTWHFIYIYTILLLGIGIWTDCVVSKTVNVWCRRRVEQLSELAIINVVSNKQTGPRLASLGNSKLSE